MTAIQFIASDMMAFGDTYNEIEILSQLNTAIS